MPRFSSTENLYIPLKGEKVPIDEALVDNVDKIDLSIKGVKQRLDVVESTLSGLNGSGGSGGSNIEVSDTEPTDLTKTIWFDII